MDIRFLTTFIEVVNTRHFGKAAENLYLTQSAVSARIKLLEEYFQTTLFVRHRNSIQLTPAGKKLLPFAHQLSDTLKEAKRELQLESGEYVVCGATQLASELCLTSTLSRIHQSFPDWSVKAEVLTPDNLTRQLHERVIDLAFSTEPLKSEEIQSELILQQPLNVYAVNYNADEIAPADFIAIDWGSKARDVLLTHNHHLRDAKLQTNSLRLAVSALEEEGGIAVLPADSASLFSKGTSIRKVMALDAIHSSVYMNSMKIIKRSGLSELIAQLSPSHAIMA
ncbi:LysR family transcriptional regulator [Alteromonas pelagimontana]|uniref:LysR family transcriptional regulator n=1 Tax=Alteromonas pelagimontana TaxID=1858656 RepID=A0A6M4MJR6_9ALTE|nr:LysR family transcriptional regulator [Alteromonas pelagimontana]QJR82326.1 LysR family transcriptional regulator [Alteromonas pelagimontana]